MIITDTLKEKYIGKRIMIDSKFSACPKSYIIHDVDELGWTFRLCNDEGEESTPVCERFISHSSELRFLFW